MTAPDPTPTASEQLAAEFPPGRRLRPGQRCRVWTSDLVGRLTLVHETDEILLEAPNWTRDGRLLLNGDGRLWTLPAELGADGGLTRPEPIRVEGLPAVNNDHVVSPDGLTVYASANDRHVHAVPLAGGAARRVTPRRRPPPLPPRRQPRRHHPRLHRPGDRRRRSDDRRVPARPAAAVGELAPNDQEGGRP